MEKPVLSGRCGCGEVTYTCTGFPQHLDFCYCLTCQQVTGAPFGAWTGVKRDTIKWEGMTAKYRVCDFATRSLCVQCGGTLAIQYDCYPAKTHLAAGTVTRGAELLPRVGMHIFVRSKPAWYDIPEGDGVPRFEAFDPEFEGVRRRFELQTGRRHPDYQPADDLRDHQSLATS